MPSALTASWVTLAVTVPPPGSVRTTIDDTAPFSTRATVPASWLRADNFQPAKSLTSTTSEALTRAIASTPFFTRRLAAEAVEIAATISRLPLTFSVTCVVAVPFCTAVTVPANWLRALVFIESLLRMVASCG